MKDVLAQEGVRVESVEDDFQDDHYDVPVNGERFRVYGRPVGNSWAVSLRERLFGVYGGNDGRAVFLTEEMCQYLGGLSWIDRRWMPYTASTIDSGE